MKYLKTFEDHDDLLASLKGLSDQLNRLKILTKLDYRQKMPQEIIDDYFLEFEESEGFKIFKYRNREGIGPIHIQLCNIIDKENVESELYRYVNKLKSIQKRIENLSFDCHFQILLNGKSQADLNPKTNRNDDYKFKGLGDNSNGYDGKGVYHKDKLSGYELNDKGYTQSMPNEVAIKIDFYII